MYDIQNPSNDESCSLFATEPMCIDRRTFLDPFRTYCVWKEHEAVSAGTLLEMKANNVLNKILLIGNSKVQNCVYNEDNESMVFSIVLIILNTIVSLLVNLILTLIMKCLKSSRSKAKDGRKILTPFYAISDDISGVRDQLNEMDDLSTSIAESVQQYRNTTRFSLLLPGAQGDDFYCNSLKMLNRSSDTAHKVFILHTLYLDMLDRRSSEGRLLWMYLKREFMQLDYCSIYLQAFAVLALIAMNGGSIYYVMLKGITKGDWWQYKFLRLFAWGYFSEVLVIQVLEIAWMEILVPSMIYEDVIAVYQTLLSYVPKLLIMESSDTKEADTKASNELDYVSLKFALRSPGLLESRLIRSVLKSNSNNLKGLINKTKSSRMTTFLLPILGFIPLQFHLVFAGMTSSGILTIAIFLWYKLGFLVVLLLFGVFIVIYQYIRDNRKLRPVQHRYSDEIPRNHQVIIEIKDDPIDEKAEGKVSGLVETKVVEINRSKREIVPLEDVSIHNQSHDYLFQAAPVVRTESEVDHDHIVSAFTYEPSLVDMDETIRLLSLLNINSETEGDDYLSLSDETKDLEEEEEDSDEFEERSGEDDDEKEDLLKVVEAKAETSIENDNSEAMEVETINVPEKVTEVTTKPKGKVEQVTFLEDIPTKVNQRDIKKSEQERTIKTPNTPNTPKRKQRVTISQPSPAIHIGEIKISRVSSPKKTTLESITRASSPRKTPEIAARASSPSKMLARASSPKRMMTSEGERASSPKKVISEKARAKKVKAAKSKKLREQKQKLKNLTKKMKIS